MNRPAVLERPGERSRHHLDVEAERRFWRQEAGGEFAHRCYEGDGLRFWQSFTASAEGYYPLRSEVALIDRHAKDIARLVRQDLAADGELTLVELGMGSEASLEAKTAKIVDAVQPTRFIGADFSGDVLRTADKYLAQRFPDVPFTGLQTDFNRARMPLPTSSRRLIVQFGSTISNVPGRRNDPLPVEALRASLQNYRAALQPGDVLVIGYDSNQDGQSATDAYRHSDHAAFSCNLLTVMAGDPAIEGLRPQDFRYEPRWHAHASLVTHDLVAECRGDFRLAREPMNYEAGDAFNYSNCSCPHTWCNSQSERGRRVAFA